MSVPPVCIFCGVPNRQLSTEHLLPKAIRQAFPELRTSRFYRHPNPSGELDSWNASSFEARVRVVCKSCNETWMSRIEKAVGPFLADLVRPGKPFFLDAYQQRDLATWGFLKGTLYQHTGKQIVVPDAHVKDLYRLHRPPTSATVWIVAYNRPFALTTFRASGGVFDRPDTGELYVLTWSVGTLAFHIFGHTSKNRYQSDFGEQDRLLMRIWPAGGLIGWPPAAHVDDNGIEKLHYSLRANLTDEVHALRQRGIAERIRSSFPDTASRSGEARSG